MPGSVSLRPCIDNLSSRRIPACRIQNCMWPSPDRGCRLGGNFLRSGPGTPPPPNGGLLWLSSMASAGSASASRMKTRLPWRCGGSSVKQPFGDRVMSSTWFRWYASAHGAGLVHQDAPFQSQMHARASANRHEKRTSLPAGRWCHRAEVRLATLLVARAATCQNQLCDPVPRPWVGSPAATPAATRRIPLVTPKRPTTASIVITPARMARSWTAERQGSSQSPLLHLAQLPSLPPRRPQGPLPLGGGGRWQAVLCW